MRNKESEPRQKKLRFKLLTISIAFENCHLVCVMLAPQEVIWIFRAPELFFWFPFQSILCELTPKNDFTSFHRFYSLCVIFLRKKSMFWRLEGCSLSHTPPYYKNSRLHLLKASAHVLFLMHLCSQQDHLRMNVAPDQTFILGLHIFLDHRTHSQMLGKIEYTLPAKFWRLVGCTEMLSW